MAPAEANHTSTNAKQNLLVAACLLAIGVSGFLIWRSSQPERLKEDHKPFEAIAALAARETATLLGGSGKLVTVSETANPTEPIVARHVAMIARKAESEVAAFKSTLGKGYTFLPSEKLLRGASTMDPVWPPGMFERVANSLPDGGVMVSFAILPVFSPQDKAVIRRRNLRVIVVGQRVANLEALVEDKTVALAVVFKKQFPVKPTVSAETPEQWLQRVVEVLR